MPDAERREPEALHALRNHLAVVVSFAGLLLEDLPESDPRHGDVLEIQNAALAAMAVMPRVAALAQSVNKEIA